MEWSTPAFWDSGATISVDLVLGMRYNYDSERLNTYFGAAMSQSAALQFQRSEEHRSELQSPCISYAVFCLKKSNRQSVQPSASASAGRGGRGRPGRHRS